MTRIIVIPDTQCKPGQDFTFLSWIGKYVADKKPDVLVQIGDFADMSSLSSYDIGKKSFEGRRYTDDIEAANKAMDYLMAPILKEQLRLESNKKKKWKPRLVLTMGNHSNRIDRAIENDRKLEGLISTDDLNYKEFGWEVIPFLEPIVIENIVFCHYLCSGVMGRPITTARMLLTKKHMSCIVGHQQGRDVAYSHRGDGRQITSIIAGSCYEHNESYLNHQTNEHWRGIVVLNEVVDGTFDECFVSLNYLKKKYDSKK